MTNLGDALPVNHDEEDDFVKDVAPEDLVYFLVNVGDADLQLLLLPKRRDGGRQAIVVDVARVNKLESLLSQLIERGLLRSPPLGRSPLFPVVCATHPHHDHIAGAAAFLDRWHTEVGELWEPGYYHPSAAFIEMMGALERRGIAHSQPTSGFTRFVGLLKLTVLTPAVELRNRFDTYGVDLNDASLSLKVEFPASRVERRDGRRDLRDRRLRKLILGADSQALSWAAAMMDFPELGPDSSAVATALRRATGASPLKADMFKVPHHGSKHGVTPRARRADRSPTGPALVRYRRRPLQLPVRNCGRGPARSKGADRERPGQRPCR